METSWSTVFVHLLVNVYEKKFLHYIFIAHNFNSEAPVQHGLRRSSAECAVDQKRIF